jgi:molecular chaperone DnaJ
VFQRNGRHLTLELPVSVREAALGARIEVPTLDGRATLTIPPGTDSGTRLRMRGKGVPDPRGGAPGDLLVQVQIHVPRGLDEDAKASLEALESFEDPALRKKLFS